MQGVVTEPVAVAPLANELFDDTDVADETDPDEELLSPLWFPKAFLKRKRVCERDW